jgi:hypothetical protein
LPVLPVPCFSLPLVLDCVDFDADPDAFCSESFDFDRESFRFVESSAWDIHHSFALLVMDDEECPDRSMESAGLISAAARAMRAPVVTHHRHALQKSCRGHRGFTSAVARRVRQRTGFPADRRNPARSLVQGSLTTSHHA